MLSKDQWQAEQERMEDELGDEQDSMKLIDVKDFPAYYAECVEYINMVNARFDEVFMKLEVSDEHIPKDK